MTVTSLLALFGAMFVLAAIPGPAVFTIVARSFANGFSRGANILLGVICGDFIFILLALFGLSALMDAMGSTFIVIKYLSACYLIYLGYKLFTSHKKSLDVENVEEASLAKDFFTGMFITLSNPKAILFYVSFFPAFINQGSVTLTDVILILLVTTAAFCIVNLYYAYLATKAKKLFKSDDTMTTINKIAGGIMIGAGVAIAAKA